MQSDAMAVVHTTCAYCGVGCGIRAQVTGERAVRIQGDPDHPANFGRLCSKGTHLGETVGLEGRLLHPKIGERRAEWDDALDLVAQKLRTTIDVHGPDSVAFYVSGQLLTEDYYVANKLMKGFIGSANIDTNSRLCMASAVAAHVRAFGEDVVPCTYDDLEAADLILLVGSNTAWCHPVVWQRIETARALRGTKLVVIDPRRTETAEQADLHIPVRPDGDVALFNALLAEMRDRGLIDGAYLATRCSVPEGFIDSREAGSHGIAPETFAKLADLVAAHPRMLTLFSQGANQSRFGTDKGNAIINLHLAMGRISKDGAGPFSITGQPNAMGGREVGGLANTLVCHLGFSEKEREDVASFWKTHRICTGPGLKAVDLFRAVHDGTIKFLWVMATNPAVSMPDATFVREALSRCETVVVSDVIAETDTAQLAHVRLPALAWGEKEGTVTNSERRISRQRAIFPSPGQSRPDWKILCDVADRMGWGEAFSYTHPSQIFDEYAAMTALSAKRGKVLDLTMLTDMGTAEYEEMPPVRWGAAHPFADRFSHADGKAELVAVEAAADRKSNAAWPLQLNTGRYRDQWHTMTRTGLSAALSHHLREPLLEIHPEDALRYGLTDGGFARVVTAAGSSMFRVHVADGQTPGDIFVPMHWADDMSNGGRANRLTLSDADVISGQPGFKKTPARVEAVQPKWRAFCVSRAELTVPTVLWSCRSRVSGGWLYELAGDADLEVRSLLPNGNCLDAADDGRGMQRSVVLSANGRLEAAFFLTRTGQLPPRDWVSSQLGEQNGSALELLAGRSARPMRDRGSIVCVCHSIGANDIAEAVHGGASTVEAVGCATSAGTNCGSCRPAIARWIDRILDQVREAAE